MTRISRRVLMRGGAVAGFAAMAGAASAFGPPSGTLRLALPTLPVKLDRMRGLAAAVLGPGTLFETLTEVTATGELTGELAQGWQSAEGGRLWRFDLREGARFHDGRAVRAEDVAASLKGLPRLAKARASGAAVELSLTAPDPDLPFRLADPAWTVAPGGDRAAGIGSGLYRLEQLGPTIRLARVAQHWKDGRAGWFDRVERTAADAAGRLEMLRRGEVDAASLAPGPLPARMRGVRFARLAGNQHYVLSCPTPEIARALAPAIDRARLVEEALAGLGRPGADHPIGPANAYAVFAPPPHDPFRARADLAALGLAGAELGLHVTPGVPAPVLRAIRETLTDAGLQLVAARAGRADLTLYRASGRMTEDAALLALPTPPEGLDAALTAPDRAGAYAALQSEVSARGSVLIPAFADYVIGHSLRLARPATLGHGFDLDDGRIAERWAFA